MIRLQMNLKYKTIFNNNIIKNIYYPCVVMDLNQNYIKKYEAFKKYI